MQLYPNVREALNELCRTYHIGIVSYAQSCYILPELKATGLDDYHFDPIIISAHYGFRKPDKRLFNKALERMKLEASEVIFVGNDMFRDIYGASQLGIKTILIESN